MPNSTPVLVSPRQETLNFLRQFARSYRPQTMSECSSVPTPVGSC